MGYALCLRSDHPGDGTVRGLWREAERFEARPSMALLGYPPHVTLALYDDGATEDADALAALDRASRGLRALTLTFDAVRSFDGPPIIL